MLSLPPPTRIPWATVEVGGKKVELFLSPEWARYFQSLNAEVQSSGSALAQSPALTALMAEASSEPDVIPGPPGERGLEGAAGLALFMLQDSPDEQQMFVPPVVDGVYVPLASKDAQDGVPALTGFKLNLKNAAGAITSWFSSVATAARTWAMPDKSGTVALVEDFASPPAIGSTAPAAGKFTTLAATSYVGLSPANENVEIKPTGTGSATIAPAQAGAMDNVVVGATTPRDGHFQSLYVQYGFACNGKAPQGPAASGGTLAGVIAALVANGILSS